MSSDDSLMWRTLGAEHEEESEGFDGESMLVGVRDRRPVFIGSL